jgi:hypothetical protein
VHFILFILHDTGFKRLTQQEWQALDKSKTITLEPWGRIEGTVKVGTQPGKGVQVEGTVLFNDGYTHNSNEPSVYMHYTAIADESGKFSFERVAPSFVRVARTMTPHNHGVNNPAAQSFFPLDRIELKPGETATVTLGGVGRPVVGKLVPPEEIDHWWTHARLECSEPPEDIDFRNIDFNNEELMKEIMEAQYRNFAKRENSLRSAVAPDGTFRIDDVSEGDWQLTVTLDSYPQGQWKRIGTLEHTFTVAAIPGGVSDEPMDLGTLEIKKPAPENLPMMGFIPAMD